MPEQLIYRHFCTKMCESESRRRRPLSSSEIERQDYEDRDSGVGSPLLVSRRSPAVSLAIKRVSPKLISSKAYI